MSGDTRGEEGEIKALASDDEAPPEIQRFLSPPPPPPDGPPSSSQGSQASARRRSRRPVRGSAPIGSPDGKSLQESSPPGGLAKAPEAGSAPPSTIPDAVPAGPAGPAAPASIGSKPPSARTRDSKPPEPRRAFPSNPDGSVRAGPVIPPSPPVPTMPTRNAPTLRTVPRPRPATLDGIKRRGSEPSIEVVSSPPPASPGAASPIDGMDDNARTLERAPMATLPDAPAQATQATQATQAGEPEYEVIRPMRIINIGAPESMGSPELTHPPGFSKPLQGSTESPETVPNPIHGALEGAVLKPFQATRPPPPIVDRDITSSPVVEAPAPSLARPSKPPVPSGPLPPLVPPSDAARFPPTPPVVEVDPDDEEDEDWGPSRSSSGNAEKGSPKPLQAPPPQAERQSAPSEIEIDPFASDDEHERISDLEIAAHAESAEIALEVREALEPATPKKPPPPPKRPTTSGEFDTSLDGVSAKSPPAPTAPTAPTTSAGGPPPPPAAPSGAPRLVDPSLAKRQKPWWEEIFSDDYIRTMEKLDAKAVKKECDFIEDRLGLERGAIMLDLACGAGAHAVELAQRGYNVVGYDLSLAMLALAQDEAQERGQKINFLQGDMREMAFEEAFDGIYSWSTSFGYFDDEKNLNVLSRVHRALRQGGMFLLDVANRDYVCARQPSLVWFEGDDCVSMDEMFVDFFTSRLRVKRTVLFEDGRSRECDYGIRLYGLHELGKMLHETGFKVVEVTGHPAHPGVFFGSESPRIIILAERA